MTGNANRTSSRSPLVSKHRAKELHSWACAFALMRRAFQVGEGSPHVKPTYQTNRTDCQLRPHAECFGRRKRIPGGCGR